MEKIGIIIVGTASVVMLGVVGMLKAIRQGSTADSVAILKQRLAKGEISEDDYRRLRAVLQEKN